MTQYDAKFYDAIREGCEASARAVVPVVLDRIGPVTSVVDVGCGEAPWRAVLKRLRPELEYRGLDASEYAIARYGRTRNIGLATFGQLGELRFETRFDLIVCSDVLHYVSAREAYNIVKAAEAGMQGNPGDYRDFHLPPPRASWAGGRQAQAAA